jgi:hypothetical protein
MDTYLDEQTGIVFKKLDRIERALRKLLEELPAGPLWASISARNILDHNE